MKNLNPTLALLCFVILSMTLQHCSSPASDEIYKTETLKITQLTSNTYIHETYLQTEDFGYVGCNGLIWSGDDGVVVFDTPTSDSISVELMTWVENHLKRKVKAVIVSHFHGDCLGGLEAFHEKGISSYAHDQTIVLARESGKVLPQNGFTGELASSEVKGVESKFLGEGHTKDNIVSYIPSEKVLFGGCLIKTLKAGKGYIDDGNVAEWSATVRKVKQTYPEVENVVPGHGRSGGTELLDYTIELFLPKS